MNPDQQTDSVEKQEIRILLVDDEADIREFLGYNLAREGYVVEKAANGAQAVSIARTFRPHLVVLDVMMPGMDGMETCAILRSLPELQDPLIVFLTARGEDYSQIAGFEAGADDYITKPIRPKLFLSRIQAILRRVHEARPPAEAGEEKLETGGLIIDRSKYVVIREGKEISLPRKEFELLRFLAASSGRVVTRDEIFTEVWGDDVVVGERTIDVHIRRIRERLGLDNIRTIKGVGYKFEER